MITEGEAGYCVVCGASLDGLDYEMKMCGNCGEPIET